MWTNNNTNRIKWGLLSAIICFNCFSLVGLDSDESFERPGDVTELLSTRSIDQTEDGTIWFGTDRCLYSFDGYDLRLFPGEIGPKQINTLQHHGDVIYLGCNDGLYTFNANTEQYQSIGRFEGSIVRKLVMCDGILYVGGESGLYSYRTDDMDATSVISRISNQSIFSLALHNGILWVGTSDGIGRYDCITDRYDELAIEIGGQRQIIPSLHIDGLRNILWAGTASSLVKIDLSSGRTDNVARVRVAKDICPDGDDGLYIGADNGLFHYKFSDGEILRVSASVVCQGFVDRDSDIWFASENGLFTSRKSTLLKTLHTGNIPENTLFSHIHIDSKGRLWAASAHGLLLYESDDVQQYRQLARYSTEGSSFHLPNDKVKTIVEDPNDGSIYIATDAGCLKYDENAKSFDVISIKGSHNWIYDILVDGNRLWVAGFDGLFCISDGEVIDKYTTSNGLSVNDIAQLAEDNAGNIWILTRDRKLFVLDKNEKTIKQKESGTSTGSSYVNCIVRDSNGDIWLATGNEVFCCRSDGRSQAASKVILESQKPLDVYSMADIAGKIWICTSEGIFILDKTDFSVEYVNSGKTYVCAAYDGSRGNILLGALDRIACLPVSGTSSLTRRDDSRIRITSVKVNDARQLDKSLIGSGSIVLPARENNLLISFSDFNYSNDFPRRFHVHVKGHNTQWMILTQGNSFNVPDMKPGTYKLFITTKDALSHSDDELLNIKIKRPWYSSIAMLLVYLACLASLVIGLIRYYTLKKYLELERSQRDTLLKQSREKEEFFGNIAHEFKTPLSLIIAPLSKLIQDSSDPAEKKILQLAHDNAIKLNTLVHHTINYYRDDIRKFDDISRVEVEFVEFARAIFNSYKENHPELDFLFDSSCGRIGACVDVAKMEIVMNNLLSNACKFTPAGGSVIMTLDRDESKDMLLIKVSDTGIGIPENEQSLVFQRYYESSRTKGANFDSTGIGLSIIKLLVECHSGTISVSSDNNGTTFTIVLPCHGEGWLPSSPSGTDMPADSQGDDKPVVVIVDDNVQICTFLETVLEEKYRCISTNNGKSGLKLCKDVIPDLIVTDVMMPVMDGLEMCRLIRQCPALSTIPIIMLTAKADTGTERRSIELDIDSFITKPFELSTLVARIDQLIGNKKRMEHKIRLEMISTPNPEHRESYDEKFLKKVTHLIEQHMEESEFSVRTLCELGGYSEKQLYRKVKQLTGLPTVEYIRSIKLKKAALLFQNGNYTVSEVMYMVGFSNASYFTRAFVAEYGKTPSEYLKSYKKAL